MSEIDELRDFVNERLAMAAMEIFGRYEKTFAKWQREICRSSEEKAQDVQQLSLPEATHIKNEQERRTSPGGDQFCLFDVQQLSIPGPPQIKEEPEPMSIQQEEQLHGLQSDTTDFVLVSPRGQTNLNWEHSSQLQPPGHTPTVENRGHSLSTTIIEEPIRLESAEGYSDSPPPFVTPSFPPSLKEEKRGGLLPNLNSLKSSCTQADCLIPSPCSSTGLSLGPSTSPWTRAIPSSGSGSEGPSQSSSSVRSPDCTGISQSPPSPGESEDHFILDLIACDPHEEAATAGESQPKRPRLVNPEARALIEKILKSKPAGGQVMQEYRRTNALTDIRRRQMVNLLAAEMTQVHGKSPPKSVRVMYAQGIVALFPYLEDPYSRHGYEHFYDPDSGSGYLAWRLKTLQRKTADKKSSFGSKAPTERRKTAVKRGGFRCKVTPTVGGPGYRRQPATSDEEPNVDDIQEAIAAMKYSSDKDVVRQKMRTTFHYRQLMLSDASKSAEIISLFPHFLDTPGLIEQDFKLLFGEATANRFLERWPTTFKGKVMKESCGRMPTPELQYLRFNVESPDEVESGWDSDMSAILLLLHLLPPSAQGRKRPGRMSASSAVDQLIRFQRIGTSVQRQLDDISQSSQPYLLAQGHTRSSVHAYFIVIDKHVLPCEATGAVGAFDELFKAHFVFGTPYSSFLNNLFTFLQTTVYNIDVGNTRETPRVRELRAKMMNLD